TGIAQIGRYFDLRPAHRQFWTKTGGAQMCVIAGDTGSGKSNHVAATLALAHRCPLVATALLDPPSGSSQPDWSGTHHLDGGAPSPATPDPGSPTMSRRPWLWRPAAP